MISPAQWRRFLKPTYRKVFAVAKSHGVKVWFHSCGTFRPVLPDLIECGMDVWETVQVHLKGNEPEVLKREYGRDLAFYGAISTQQTLPHGTPRTCVARFARGSASWAKEAATSAAAIMASSRMCPLRTWSPCWTKRNNSGFEADAYRKRETARSSSHQGLPGRPPLVWNSALNSSTAERGNEYHDSTRTMASRVLGKVARPHPLRLLGNCGGYFAAFDRPPLCFRAGALGTPGRRQADFSRPRHPRETVHTWHIPRNSKSGMSESKRCRTPAEITSRT